MTPFAGRQKVTSPYGNRLDPFGSGKQVWHGGIDVTAQEGRWEVRETTGGTVTEVKPGYNGGRGNLVRVQSGNAVVTTQHYERIDVAVGQVLRQGEVLGKAGASGDVTGVHLHFEVQQGGKQVNPAAWLGLPNATGVYDGNDDLDEARAGEGSSESSEGNEGSGSNAAGKEKEDENKSEMKKQLAAAMMQCAEALAECAKTLEEM